MREEQQGFNPFPGLRPFTEEEDYLFFGREAQSNALLRCLRQTRFLAVVGTSGSGKSSLVFAGMLPALHGGVMTQAGSSWRVAILRPGNNPIGALAGALSRPDVFGADSYTEDDEAPAIPQPVITETTLRRSALGLVEVVQQARLPQGENLLIVVDQFEELFRFKAATQETHSADDSAAFVKLLLEASRVTTVPIYIVLTMRSDFLGECAQFRDLPEAINAGQFLIPRMTRDQRRQAIEGPTAVGGAQMTPRLLQRLLNDVGDNPDQLPILQHALMRTWDKWSDNGARALDLSHYEAIGGMATALSQHADEVYQSLPDDRSRALATKLFKALIDTGPDNRGIRRPTRLSDLCAIVSATPAEVRIVIEAFRQPSCSFLVPPARVRLTADPVIDISHESLMRVWQRLKTWVEEEAQSAQMYRRLAETAALYPERAGLWQDPDLQLALDWRNQNQPTEAWAVRYHREFARAIRFLEDSHTASEADRQKEEAARRRELVQAQALAEERARRITEQETAAVRSRRFLIGLLVALGIAVGAVAAVFWLKTVADNNSQQATLYWWIAEAANHVQQRLDLALLLSVEASYAVDNQKTRESLLTGLLSTPQLVTFLHGHEKEVLSVAFSPDGTTMASGGTDKKIQLWDIATRTQMASFPQEHEKTIRSLAFSPDGRVLASGSSDQTTPLLLWDVSTRRRLAGLKMEDVHSIRTIAFSPDGKRLASGSREGSIHVWDIATRSLLTPLRAHAKTVRSIAFHPDGTLLASGSTDNTVRLWDVSQSPPTPYGQPLTGHQGDVLSVAFHPDGTLLASGSTDNTVRLWDISQSPPTPHGQPLTGHQGDVLSVAFSRDGTLLASGSVDNTVRVWDVMTHTLRGQPLIGHQGDVHSVAFRPTGQPEILVSGSDDSTILLWDVSSAPSLGAPLVGHKGTVHSVTFSPDAKTLVSGSEDGTIRLWDTETDQSGNTRPPSPLPLKAGTAVMSVAFHPKRPIVAFGSDDGSLYLWDRNTQSPLGPSLTQDRATIWSIAFHPDGALLASGGADSTIRLWDVSTPTQPLPLGEPLSHSDHNGKDVRSVAFHPNGSLLASGGADNTVRLWDISAPTQPALLGKPLSGHTRDVRSVAFHPNGTLLASGSSDNTIRVWDLTTPRHALPAGEPLIGHQGDVQSVSFHPAGRILASGGDDNTIRLWDLTHYSPLGPPLGARLGSVQSVVFSPDGTILASGGSSNLLRVWKADFLWSGDVEAWRKRACHRANRNFSCDEWQSYMGDEPYRATCQELPQELPVDQCQ